MLEGQTFPEVFPDYTVPENLKYILSNAVVSKVEKAVSDSFKE